MAKYKFKLEPLLKLRRAKELTAKIELGKINKELKIRRDKIKTFKNSIGTAYSGHEEYGKGGAIARELSFFSEYINSARHHIFHLENEIERLQVTFKERLKVLEKARAETKVVEKLKEKDYEKYKKELQKKIDIEIEDDYIISKSSKDLIL